MSLTLNMVGGGGGIKPNKPLIHVNATLGATVDFILGGIVEESITPANAIPNEDGTTADYYYSTDSTGTFTILAKLNGDSVSKTVSVSTAIQYDVYMPKLVPMTHQAVEYLESSGTQWIDTGIVPNAKTTAQIKFMNLVVTGNAIFGYYTGSDTNDWRLFNYESKYYFDRIADRINGGSCPADTLQELELGNYFVKDVNSGTTIISGSAANFVGVSTITLNHTSSANSNNRWYYAKIFSYGFIVSDLIPCYRKSDSVAGMFDRVSGSFLTNSGTGSFIVGADKE